MKTESEIKAARELHKLLAEACKTANAASASATLCNQDGGPVDNLTDSELAKASELYVALDIIPWRDGVRALTESGRREMVVEQNTLDAIQRLAEKHGTLGEQYHIDSIDGPGYGWQVTAKPQRHHITRGDYYGTTDNRADRWYIDSIDGPVERQGKGYRTAELAQDALDALVAGLDWQAMPRD